MAAFEWEDHLVFAIMLVVSLAIGFYFSWQSYRRKSTATDYLIASHNMSYLPTTISLTVSFISAFYFLGYPAETYAFGNQFWFFTAGISLGTVIAAVLYVPLIYPLKITSANEYLEMRFNSVTVKIIGSLTSICGMIIGAAVSMYGPSIAAETVTGLPTWGAILVCGGVAIAYTTLGGIRAVIWVDVFQAMVMVVGMFTVAIKAILAVGSLSTVWDLNEDYGRMDIIVTDPDPTLRVNLWGLLFGTAFTYSGVYGVGQPSVQRYAALPNGRQAFFCVLGMIPGLVTLVVLGCLCGTAIFAYYAQLGCDPLKEGLIRSPNQIMMYFASDVLTVPGIPGLFLAAVWAGSLSTVSSYLNSSAANLWRDVVRQRLPNVSHTVASRVLKVFVLFFGVCAIGLAFIMNRAGTTTLVEITGVFTAALIGPSKGVVFLGGFVPWVNWIGATVGCLASFVFGVWVSMSSVFHKIPPFFPDAPTYNCPNTNITTTMAVDNTTTLTSLISTTQASGTPGIYKLYSISYLWLPTICICINIFVAIVVSILTGMTDRKSLSPRLVHPWIRRFVGSPDTEDEKKIRNGEPQSRGSINDAYPWTRTEGVVNEKDQNTKM